MIKKAIIWGGKSHAKFIRPILAAEGIEVVAIFDDTPGLESPFADIPIYQGWQAFKTWYASNQAEKIGFCVAISNPYANARIEIGKKLEQFGLTAIPVIHKSAQICPTAQLGNAVQIFAGAIINSDAKIASHCILSSNTLIEHEVSLGEGVHVGPSATILGLTSIGSYSLIGAGALILSRLQIGENVFVGANALIESNLHNDTRVETPTKRPF